MADARNASGDIGIAPTCSTRSGLDDVPSSSPPARRFGATDVVDASARDPVEQIRELTGGGVDPAFECVGLKLTAEQSFACLRTAGTATIIGLLPIGTKRELHGFGFLRERRIQGCSMGSNRLRTDMPRLVDWYLKGRPHRDDTVSSRIRLDDVNEGFAAMKRGGVARSVIVFDGPGGTAAART